MKIYSLCNFEKSLIRDKKAMKKHQRLALMASMSSWYSASVR